MKDVQRSPHRIKQGKKRSKRHASKIRQTSLQNKLSKEARSFMIAKQRQKVATIKAGA